MFTVIKVVKDGAPYQLVVVDVEGTLSNGARSIRRTFGLYAPAHDVVCNPSDDMHDLMIRQAATNFIAEQNYVEVDIRDTLDGIAGRYKAEQYPMSSPQQSALN